MDKWNIIIYNNIKKYYNVRLSDFHSYFKIVKASEYHRKIYEAIKIGILKKRKRTRFYTLSVY